MPKLTQRLLHLADLKPHESVLDLGCGDGVLTKGLQDTQSRVVGIDNQQDMVQAARKAGVIDVRCIRAQDLQDQADLQREDFDVVFTNAVLHWIPDLRDGENPTILTAVLKALKPGGRFVGEFGAFLNVSEILGVLFTSMIHHGVSITTIRDEVMPFFFASEKEWRALLEHAGFNVLHVETETRPTVLPGKISHWVETFLERYLAQLGKERKAVLAELDSVLELTNRDEEGTYYANYRRIRFVATKR